MKIDKKIKEAEKRIKELLENEDLKKLSEIDGVNISKFFETKSLNRLQSAKIIFEQSSKEENYQDFSEVVSCNYYAMYYIIHSFLALKYRIKLRDNLRGVHAITHHLILYYLVKTGKLEKHLYDEYVNTLETASEIQNLDFKEKAFEYANKYKQQRDKRETFTYSTSKSAEQHHAEHSIAVAEEFINTIRQLMI